MGQRGPVPKRSSQRRRQNKESKTEKVTPPAEVEFPPAAESWHDTAREWYESLAESGQAQFYEPSDWQAARFLADELTSYLNSPKKSAIMFAHLWSAMTDLLTTEGSRRRVKLEVERASEPVDPNSEVTDLDEFRRRASSG